MCTSFVVYADRPLYGMNFDFPDVELKFEIRSGQWGKGFYLCFLWDGRSPAVSGVNAAGLFSAAQILVAPFEVVTRADETLVSPSEVFTRALDTGQRVDDVLKILAGRRLGYTTERKGHQLYADRFGEACVLEPGPERDLIYRYQGPFAVMANSPIRREMDRAARHRTRLGVDRYQVATQFLEGRWADFTWDDGFELLERTALCRGRFRTQCSMVCDPLAGQIYLTLGRNFKQVWKVHIQSAEVESFSGFGQQRRLPMAQGAVTSTELLVLAQPNHGMIY